jgi:hypothetical protein
MQANPNEARHEAERRSNNEARGPDERSESRHEAERRSNHEARDPAVDAVLVADTLIGQLAMPASDPTIAITEVQRLHPAIWEQLDRAHDHLRDRGIAVAEYDALRGGAASADLGALRTSRDLALRGARRASDALKAALPTVDWAKMRSIEDRAAKIQAARLTSDRWKGPVRGIVVALVVGLIAYGIIAVTRRDDGGGGEGVREVEIARPTRSRPVRQVIPPTPPPPETPETKAARELEALEAEFDRAPCFVEPAENLLARYIELGRSADAAKAGDGWLEQCGKSDKTAKIEQLVARAKAGKP